MLLRRFLTPVITAVVLALAGLAFCAFNVQAAPVAPFDIVITQPDGSTITVSRWGDEYQHGVETQEGYTLVKDASSRFWVYAELQNDGTLGPATSNGGPAIAGADAPRPGLAKHIRPTAQTQSRLASAPVNRSQNIGTEKMLFLLVDYADQAHTVSATEFQAKAFGAANSIANFYNQASFGKLIIAPATESNGTTNDGVIGWLRLSGSFPADAYASASTIVTDALNAANPSINFATYDTDGDGYVTSTELHIVVILAGYEESYCSPNCGSLNVIWAHQGWIDVPLNLDGKFVAQGSADGDYGGYAMFGEKHGFGSASDTHPATIGVMAHELGHALSWPDLYDTSGASQGVGNWSIMGGGSWNGTNYPGDSPALPDAWLKWYQGWLTPIQIQTGQHYNVLSAYNNDKAYLLGTNPGGVDWNFTKNVGTGQYWLIENRFQAGYDAGLPGCGLLIWHIDETVSFDNDANAHRDDPLVALEQADGLNELYNASLKDRGDPGDPFPGATGNLLFNSGSNPNSDLYGGIATPHALLIDDNATCLTSMGFASQTLTWTNTYLPMLMKPAAPPPTITGKVTDNGTAKSGQVVEMYYTTDGGNNYALRSSSTTNSSGNYSFTPPPLTNPDQKYYLYWENSASNDSWAAWYSTTTQTSSATNLVFNINIHNIAMTAPSSGTIITFPKTFTWTKRPTTSDSYEVDFFEPIGDKIYFLGYYGPLGYTGSMTLNSAPSGTGLYNNGYYYFWNVGANVPSGFASGYYLHSIAWNEYSGPALDGNPIGGWQMVEMPNICTDHQPADVYHDQKDLALQQE